MRDKQTARSIIIFLIVAVTGLSTCPCLFAENPNIGIVLADDHGNILYDQNRKTPYVPASIFKILTSLAAIHILGKPYRFPTEYFFETDSKDLYIKGFGDPLFTSEVIEQLCQDIILKTGTRQIHNIILDHTYFSDQIQIPGKSDSLNPYDASVGALCANFNTLMFKWDSKESRFISGEPQTPLLPIFTDDIKKTKLKQGRIILSKQQTLLYPGLLIKYFLEKNDINITGSVLQGTFDAKGREKYSFLSPFELEEVIQKLLQFSSNYIANHLFLTMGAKKYQAPATLEKGVKAVKLFSEKQLKLNHLVIFEGSGLSRSNLISPEQMLRVLIEFMPYRSLLNRQNNEFYKTGTLSDVRTRAGYIIGQDNKLYPYVIMVNQKNPGVETIQKKLLNIVFQMTKKGSKSGIDQRDSKNHL